MYNGNPMALLQQEMMLEMVMDQQEMLKRHQQQQMLQRAQAQAQVQAQTGQRGMPGFNMMGMPQRNHHAVHQAAAVAQHQNQQMLLQQQQMLMKQAQTPAGRNTFGHVGQQQSQPQARQVQHPQPFVHKRQQPHRNPLTEIQNHWDESGDPSAPCDDLKTVVTRERLGRNKISRMEITESARLEMQLQNINIKKHSSKAREEMESQLGFSTPKRDDPPQLVERDCSADGKPIYKFEPGTPGGMCVYFLKGFCSLGNKCRYVHDDTDDGRFVKIAGMPYDISLKVITEFFAPLVLPEANITFITSKEGKPTGSAILEFQDRKEALMAQSKDRANITDARYVLLYPSSRMEKQWHQQNAKKYQQAAAQMPPPLLLDTLPPTPTPAPAARTHAHSPIRREAVQSPFAAQSVQKPQFHNQSQPAFRMQSVLDGGASTPGASPMGLTPSPLLQLSPVSTVNTKSEPQSAQRAVQTPGLAKDEGLDGPPLLLVQPPLADEDDTMRSLLSTLNEADESEAKEEKRTSAASTTAPPPLVDMKSNDWLNVLQESLLNSEQAPKQSIPALVTTPKDELSSALRGLGFDPSTCTKIVSALEEVGRKAQLPFSNMHPPVSSGSASSPKDMPSLLPIDQ